MDLLWFKNIGGDDFVTLTHSDHGGGVLFVL